MLRAIVPAVVALTLGTGCSGRPDKTVAVSPKASTTPAAPPTAAPSTPSTVPQKTRFTPDGPLPQHFGIPSVNPRFLQRAGAGWAWVSENDVMRSKGKGSERIFEGTGYIDSLAVSAKGKTAVVVDEELRVLEAPHVVRVPRGTTVAWCGERLFVAGRSLRTLSAGKLVAYADKAGELSPASCRGGRLALRVKGGLSVHDLATKAWTRTLAASESHWPIAYDVAVSDDGRHVAAVEHLGGVHLWTHAGKRLAHWPTIGTQAGTVSFSPDGKRVQVGGNLLSVPDLHMVARAGGGGGAWSADGRRLATVDEGGVAVLDVAGVLRTPMPRGMVTAAHSMLLDTARAHIVSLDQDSRVFVWSTKTPRVLSVFHGGENQLDHERRIAWMPDGTFLLGGHGGIVRWTVDGRRLESRSIPNHAGTWVSVSRDGTRVAFAGSNEAHVIAWKTGRQLLRAKGYKKETDGMDGSVEGVCIHPDGKVLAVGGRAKSHVLDVDSGTVVATLKPLKGYGNRVWFSPDGKRLLHTSSMGARLYSWPEMTGTDLPEEAHWATNAVFSPDGSEIVLSRWAGDVVKLDLAGQGKVAWSKNAPWHVGAHAVDFKMRRGFTSGPDLELLVWDLDTGKIVDRRPAGAGRRTTALAFSPSNRFLATGGGSGAIELFDLNEGKRVASFDVSSSEIDAVRVSDAGEIVAWDGMRVMRLAPNQPKRAVEVPGICSLTTAKGDVICADVYGKQLITLGPRAASQKKKKLSKAFSGEAAVMSPDGKTWLEREDRWEPKRSNLARMIDVRSQRRIGEIDLGSDVGLQLVGWANGAGWLIDQVASDLLRWAPNQAQPTRHAIDEGLFPMAISNQHLASSRGDWVVISDVPSLSRRHVLPAHGNRIDAMAFSPDGTHLATGDFESHIYVWDVATGRARMRIVAAAGGWNVWHADGTWNEGGYSVDAP